MAPLSDFLEFAAPDEFEAAIPQDLKDHVAAMTPGEVAKRFNYLWSRFLVRNGNYPSLEERQEYFLVKKLYLKKPG